MLFPSRSSIQFLNEALQLPVTGREQDWDIELANPDRVEEFLRYFETHQLDDDKSFALMALILGSLEDLTNKGLSSTQAWVRVRQLIAERPALYADLLRKWQADDTDTDGFAISPMLALLGHEYLSKPGFSEFSKELQIPQPLSRVRSDASIFMSNAGYRPLQHNPSLGVLAMEAIISWSNVENFLLMTYVELMGGREDRAAIAFLAIEAKSAKLKVLRAVASDVLEAKYFEVFEKILKRVGTAQTSRDKLAHWTWGYSPQVPDGFLLADPRLSVRQQDGIPRSEDILVYKQTDFDVIVKENDKLCGFGLDFKFILTGHVSNKDDTLYSKLSAQLEV